MFKDSCRMLPATTTFELQCLLLRHQVLMSFAAISCFVSHKDERLKVKYLGDPCRTCPTTACYKAIQGSDIADCWKYRETSTNRTSCWNRRRKAHSKHFFCTHTLIYWFIDIHWYSLIFIDIHWYSLIFIDIHWYSLIFIDIHWYSLIFIDIHSESFRIIQNVLFRHFILRSPRQTCQNIWAFGSTTVMTRLTRVRHLGTGVAGSLAVPWISAETCWAGTSSRKKSRGFRPKIRVYHSNYIYIYHKSMDWIKGKFTGNHRFSH